MDDYISRQAAMEALDKEYRYGADIDRCGLATALDEIESLPAADVVQVVRCKDCKFRENDDFCTGRGFPCQLVPDDGFCDKGKRKE